MADETPEETSPTDWRGTPITEGALAIYGAPVGRSIALVEAEVVGFTKSGRVNLRVLRRAYGGGWSDSKDVVHVGADRLIVVLVLPPTTVPTEAEKKALRQVETDERERIRDTHDFPASYQTETQRDVHGQVIEWAHWVAPPCRKCGAENGTTEAREECSA